MRIRPREAMTVIPIEQGPDPAVDNKLELMKHASTVHTRGIKRDITSDFLFAKLDELREDATVELVEQAYFQRRMVDRVKARATEYIWDHKDRQWVKQRLPEWKIQALDLMGENTFDGFMTGPTMIAILKRNKPRNPMLKLLAGFDDSEVDSAAPEMQTEELLDHLHNKLKEKKQKKAER